MKKTITWLTALCAALLPCAAQADILTIEMCDATKEHRAQIAEQHMNAVLQEPYFETMLADLNARENLDIPETETTHALVKEQCGEYAVYTLSNDTYDNIVLYLHGGTYAYNIDPLHIQYCDRLADTLRAKVYMPIYPLAPQATWQEAYALLDELYADLLSQGKPIIIMGDSAGGGLSLGFTEYLKEKNETLPDKMVLLSPWVDVTLSNERIPEYEALDLTLASYAPIQIGKLWAGDTDCTDYHISPIYGDLTGLPETLLFVGTDEIMYPDNILLFEKMLRAENAVTLVIGEGLWHVFPITPIAEQTDALDIIADFVGA